MATLQDYLDLVISEHADKPDYIAFISIFLQGQVDNQNVLAQLPARLNLDDEVNCVGFWLDLIGSRVGQSRQVDVPLVGVYFAWATAGVGWGQGTWFGPGEPLDGLVILPDDSYRILLKAVIAANQWDGTVPGAYAVWNIAFGPNQIILQDNQDMTITIFWVGANPSAVTLALLTTGQLALKPAGVRITGYFTPSVPNAPVFGWGIESPTIQGWGQGAWVKKIGDGS